MSMYKKFYEENPPYKSEFYTEGLVVVIGDRSIYWSDELGLAFIIKQDAISSYNFATSFGLSIKSGSIISMDDYNIQDAYVSQVLSPLMELEIQVENKGVAVTH